MGFHGNSTHVAQVYACATSCSLVDLHCISQQSSEHINFVGDVYSLILATMTDAARSLARGTSTGATAPLPATAGGVTRPAVSAVQLDQRTLDAIIAGVTAQLRARPPVADGTPATGTPATGTPATGTPATGTPATGTPAAGTPAPMGTPATGTPRTAPATGTPATGGKD